KWAARQRKFITGRVPRGVSLDHEDSGVTSSSDKEAKRLEAWAIVEVILDQLTEYERWLLETHLLEGYTLAEMTEATDASRSTIRNHFNRTLRKAQRLAGVLDAGD